MSNFKPSYCGQIFTNYVLVFLNIPIFRVEKDSTMKNWGHRQFWGAPF